MIVKRKDITCRHKDKRNREKTRKNMIEKKSKEGKLNNLVLYLFKFSNSIFTKNIDPIIIINGNMI